MAACKQWRNVQYVVLFYSVIGAIYYAGYYGGVRYPTRLVDVTPVKVTTVTPVTQFNVVPVTSVNVVSVTPVKVTTVTPVTQLNVTPVTPVDVVPVTSVKVVPVTPVDVAPVTPVKVMSVTPVNVAPVTPVKVMSVTPVKVVSVTSVKVAPVTPVKVMPVTPVKVMSVTPVNVAPVTPVKVMSVTPVKVAPVTSPVTKTPGQHIFEVVHVDPMALDIPNRFDIIVKTVYAIFLFRGTVPTYVTNVYNRHLKVWNNFKEGCYRGKDWFDTKNPCNKKGSAELFQQAFSGILDSIAKDGFDATKSLIPATESGFPENGAHRIASALALGLPTVPVQRLTSKFQVHHWDFNFFKRYGFEEEYADFAMLQWTLHFSKVSTVLFWPEVASDENKMKHARAIVRKDCGGILYEKTVNISRHGVASLALHAYGNTGWLLLKIIDLQASFSGPDHNKRPVTVIFIRPISTTHLITCKPKLRSLFALAIPKSSVHIPDYHDEVVLVAEMVLNPNSVMFLNRHVGDGCREVASEIATRLKVPPVNPASFVLPQDVMVDSGAVLSFFGLRNRTDVDLLFQGNVTAALLGNQRGIHVEEHAFETNARFDEHNRRIARKRAWGAEHLSNCTVDDLFTDPQYYGYCHGMKFVSLEQLIRYKQRRGEPNKDGKDVSSLERFITGSINGTA